ncbi:MAG: malto-oligosyltrehalose synthase [Hyphomicrobiales bacterium]
MSPARTPAERTAPAAAPAGTLEPDGRPRIPSSTYRVQLGPRCRFEDLARLVPYLGRLGIGAVYTSPVVAATPESEHGYDVSDPNRLSDALGGEEGFRELALAVRGHGLGLIVDFVPNHMGVDVAVANRPWWDVLENGVCSPHARSFDIDWHPVKRELEGKVLLPILGDQYGRVLERGELSLAYDQGALVLRYYERRLPINPRRAPQVYRLGLEALARDAGAADASLREFLSILTALENLPSIVETDPARIAERSREKEVARERLARLTARDTRLLAHVQAAVRAVNGTPGDPASFDRLHALLEEQAYRLAYWRTAFHEINYRRFFDVNGLASVRMEDPAVFDETHALLLRLIRAGWVTGVRIDHLDGLSDPRQYLERLRRAIASGVPDGAPEGSGLAPEAATPAGAAPRPRRYVVAEKILSEGETLPRAWSLHGTTGYDFLNLANGLFIDPRGEKALARAYERATGDRAPFVDVVYESKKVVMETTLASELNLLAHALNRISEGDRLSRDFTLNSLHDMLREVVACLPVYRTYVTADGASADDERILADAVARARRRNPGMDESIFEFFLDVVLGRSADRLTPDGRAARVEFVSKLQQYTGPVQAKGLEDTAFYRNGLLLARNEVGGSPRRFGRAPGEFHEAMRARLRVADASMNATSTHDAKRGEDARARLDALPALAAEWSRAVSRWSRIHARCRTHVDGAWAPDRHDLYFFYQTLLGVWPAASPDVESLIERMQAYMRKAIREAKIHTSWINQNRPYERAVEDFVSQALRGRTSRRFLESFLPFTWRVARAGAVHSLAMLVLKVAAPGVPDFYQGSELWDLNLVDPDNRRPVDYEARERSIETLRPALGDAMPRDERAAMVARLLAGWEDGHVKLYATARLLRERRAHDRTFLEGAYEPLEIDGAEEGVVLAFLRRSREAAYAAVVPRLVAARAAAGFPLGEAAWGDARVRFPDWWRGARAVDVLTGAVHVPGGHDPLPRVRLAEIFGEFPAALLRLEP